MDILLTTLNSSYSHASFGLRYLKANLGELKERAHILEFTIQKHPLDIAESILALNPRIVGFGVYIWNTQETYEVIAALKKIKPELLVVLGGPEVSHESESQAICQLADYTIKGEADFVFRDFCKQILFENTLPAQKFIAGTLPEIKEIILPYDLYTDEDIKNRVVYVEVSRGCPYRCEYCLSSLDKAVRNFDLDLFLQSMQSLLDRGLRQFKFIDRTFNLSPTVCTRILNFFYSQIDLGLFLHFEMVPDRLPVEIRDLIKQFPPGSLQFEIGIQTWNPEVAKNVSRRNDYTKVKDNFQFLAQETGVHTHADLIVGLPGETLTSFAAGFDTLAALNPHEIQVGILKRLKGAPIARHDREFQMVYSDRPPFQILKNKDVSFEELQNMNRFAKFWDMIANSGSFRNFVLFMKEQALKREDRSFFWEFYEFKKYLSQRFSQAFGISQLSLFEACYEYLKEVYLLEPDTAKELILKDYSLTGRLDYPKFLQAKAAARNAKKTSVHAIPKRQRRHLAHKADVQ